MEIAALVISILALAASAAAAAYTGWSARISSRDARLQHEPQMVIEVVRGTSMAAPGQKAVGGGPVLRLRNIGKGDAREVVIVNRRSGKSSSVGFLRAGSATVFSGAVAPAERYRVEWKTIDGKKRRESLHPSRP